MIVMDQNPTAAECARLNDLCRFGELHQSRIVITRGCIDRFCNPDEPLSIFTVQSELSNKVREHKFNADDDPTADDREPILSDRNPRQYDLTQSINRADLSSVEINKIWRRKEFHNGGVFEPLLQEVDAIISFPGRKWAAFEVKMSPSEVDTAAANLLKFSERVDKEAQGEPAALVVITATGAAGQRGDGVHVVPITALAP